MKPLVPVCLLLLAGCSREGAPTSTPPPTSNEQARSESTTAASREPNEASGAETDAVVDAASLPFLAATVELTGGIALGRDARVERTWLADDEVFLWVRDDEHSRVLQIAMSPFRKVREHRLRAWVRDVDLTADRSGAILVTDEGLRAQSLGGGAPTLPTVSGEGAIESLRLLSDGSFLASRNMTLVHHTSEGERVLARDQGCTPWVSPDEGWVICSGDRVVAYSLTDDTKRERDGFPRGYLGDGPQLLLSDDRVWNLADHSVRPPRRTETWSGMTTSQGRMLDATLPDVVDGHYFSLAGPVLSPERIVPVRDRGLLVDGRDRPRILPIRFHGTPEIRRLEVGGVPRVARWIGDELLVGMKNTARVVRLDSTGRRVAEWSEPCPTSEEHADLSCGIGDLDLTADGSRAVAFVVNHGVVVFDTNDMSIVAEWPSRGTMGKELDVAGDKVVHVDRDGGVIVRRLDGDIVVRISVDDLPLEEDDGVGAVALSDDGSKLAVGLDHGVVLVYEGERRIGSIRRSREAGGAWDLVFLEGRCRIAATFSEEAAIHECNGRQVRGPLDEGSAHFRRVGDHVFEDDTLLDARFRPHRQFSRLSMLDVADSGAVAVPQRDGDRAVYLWNDPPL